MPAHPTAKYIIVAQIDGNEYRAYITDFRLIWVDPLFRYGGIAWQMEFSYLISKKREKGLIAGWELNPYEPFPFLLLPANPNKYQQNATYQGRARFREVTEDKDLTPSPAHFLLDIIGQKVV